MACKSQAAYGSKQRGFSDHVKRVMQPRKLEPQYPGTEGTSVSRKGPTCQAAWQDTFVSRKKSAAPGLELWTAGSSMLPFPASRSWKAECFPLQMTCMHAFTSLG